MTGTEFEKAAGREKAKKWKASVRVAPTNGNQGEMVGDWLQVHPLRPKHVLQLCTSFCTRFLCICRVAVEQLFVTNHVLLANHKLLC